MPATAENPYNIVTVAELTDPAYGWIAFIRDIQAREEEALTVIANGVTAKIESHLKRPVVARARTDYLDGTGTQEMSLGMFPTSALTSLESLNWNDGTTRDAYQVADYNLDADVGLVHLWRFTFPLGRKNIKVVHAPGWAAGSIPDSIQLAARFWINKLYKAWQGGVADDEIQSQSLEGMNTSYFVGEMPKKVEGMLRDYRVKGIMA